MKKSMYFPVIILTLLIGVGSAGAQMMNGNQQGMMQVSDQQQQMPQASQEYCPGGMYPGMMRGYGMGPGMMRGYGMGPGMMDGYGMSQDESPAKFEKFLQETKGLRKKIHDLRFEYGELARNPDTTMGELRKIEKQVYELQQQILEKREKLEE